MGLKDGEEMIKGGLNFIPTHTNTHAHAHASARYFVRVEALLLQF